MGDCEFECMSAGCDALTNKKSCILLVCVIYRGKYYFLQKQNNFMTFIHMTGVAVLKKFG